MFCSGSSIEDATITPKDDKYKTTMGSPMISFTDLLMINKHYNCTGIADYYISIIKPKKLTQYSTKKGSV